MILFSNSTCGRQTETHILLVISFFIFQCAFAQKKDKSVHLGSGIETSLSFNAHGNFYSGYLSFGNGIQSIKIGPLVQKRFANINGAKITYSHQLTRRNKCLVYAEEIRPVDGPIQLNAFSFIQYIHKGRLSYNRTREEILRNPEVNTDWNSQKLSTLECGVGVELMVKIAAHFELRNFMGLSIYYHPDYLTGMYHEKIAPTLVFGSGINIPRF